jgi:hypothetical protein
MFNRFGINYLFLVLLLISVNHVLAKDSDVIFTVINHQIVFESDIDKGFRDVTTITGINPTEESVFSIYSNDLEEVKDLKISFKNQKGKIKSLSSNEIEIGDSYSRSFIDDLKVINFRISKTSYFEYSYTIETVESMVFSNLDLYPKNNTSEVSYSVLIPNTLSFAYKLPQGILNLGNLTVDSLLQPDGMLYSFIFIPKKEVLDTPADRNIGKGIKSTVLTDVRVIVYPKNYTGEALGFFNDWYYDLINQLPGLNEDVKSQIDEVISNCNSKSDTISTLFDWVKSEISYIDIEQGINAFIPRDANEICKKQKGDCKDMSFLLYLGLKYLNIDAYLAISSTLSHRFDLDFPSLSSGNHVICTVANHNEFICLDPTEDLCKYPNPSRQIQGRKILIVNNSSGLFYTVPVLNASNNTSNILFNIAKTANELTGNYNISLREMSAFNLQHIYNSYSQLKFERYVKNWFVNNTDKTTVMSIEIKENDNEIALNGNAQYANSITNKIAGKTYVSLSFVPYPHDNATHIDTNQRLVTYYAATVIFIGNLIFDYKIKLIDQSPVEFKADGYYFVLKVKQVNDYEIIVEYEYKLDRVDVYSTEDIENYNNMNELILSSLHKKMILEN